MHTKIIVNPNAGGGTAKEAGYAVEKFLCDRGMEYSLEVTYRPMGAVSLAQKAVEAGFDLIIAVGGDGTVNEIVNGMAGSKTKLAVIPAGIKNDFAKMLGLSKDDLHAACETAVYGLEKTVDLGKINDRYFVNGIGIGFNTEVAKQRYKIHPFFKGKVRQALASMFTIKKFNAPTLKIKMGDVSITSRVMIANILNGKYFNGGHNIAPAADIEDGLFDVFLFKNSGKIQLLRHLSRIAKGKHTDLSNVSLFKTPYIEIDSLSDISAKCDGEIIENGRPYTIQLAKEKLLVKAN